MFELRRLRGGNSEEFGMISWNVLHVIFEAIQNPFFFLENIAEKSGFVIVDFDTSGWLGSEFLRFVD